MKFSIESDALHGCECPDNDVQWFCYDTFYAEGSSIDELIDNCSGFTMDQDGGEGREVHIDDLNPRLRAMLVEDLIARYHRAVNKEQIRLAAELKPIIGQEAEAKSKAIWDAARKLFFGGGK